MKSVEKKSIEGHNSSHADGNYEVQDTEECMNEDSRESEDNYLVRGKF